MTTFVTMYHPALNNVRVQAPVEAEALYEAHGWVLDGGTAPPPADIYLTPALGDVRYAPIGSGGGGALTDAAMASALGSSTAAAIAGRAELKAAIDAEIAAQGASGTSPVVTKAFVSNPSGTKLAQPLTLGTPAAITPTGADVVVDPTTSHQAMLGFGAALTDSAAWLLWTQLSAAQRTSLLTELFSPSQGNLSAVRVAIGSSDFSRQTFYTYDAGSGDPSMTSFSVGTGTPGTSSATKDLRYVVPILQQILSINPAVKVIGAIWSPPAWMKSSNSITGGTFNSTTANMNSLATYLVKWVQAYQALGIPIHAISPQNEPTNQTAYPSCFWAAADLNTFVGTYLGPALDSAGLVDVGVLAGDGNWSETATPTTEVAGAAAGYITAVAWHGYGGAPSAQSVVARAVGKQAYFTELRSMQADTLTTVQSVMAGTVGCQSIQRGTGLITLWNLALDQSGNPTQNSTGRRGVLTVSTASPGQVIRNPEAMMLRHLAQHLRPGAVRVTATSTLPAVAFRNPDGTVVTYLYNSGGSAVTPNVVNGATGLGVPVALGTGEAATVITGPQSAINVSIPQANGLLASGVSAAPGAPTLALVSAGTTTATLALQVGAANGSAVTVTLRYATTSGGVAGATPVTLDQTVAAVQVTGLAQGTTYFLQATATNATGSTVSGVITATTTGTSDTTAPSAPTGLTAGTPTSSTVPLTWTASTDNVAVTGYKVYRGGTVVGTPTATSFTDTGLTASTAYTYTVSAVDAAGNESAQSSSASATTAASGGGGTAPTVGTAATNTATGLTPGTSLTWSHTVAPGDKVLVVALSASVNISSVVTGVTYGGAAMTKTAEVLSGAGTTDRQADIYTLVNPTVGAATVSVQTRTATGFTISIGGTSVCANGGTGVVGTPQTTSAASATSLSVTTASDASSVVFAAAAVRSTTAPTQGAGTVLHKDVVGTNMAEVHTWQAGAASVTTSASWTTADVCALAAVSIS